VAEIQQIIGCDALIYQDIDAMKMAIGRLNPAITEFDASCFDGVYVTGDITAADIARMSASRAEGADEEGDDASLAHTNNAHA